MANKSIKFFDLRAQYLTIKNEVLNGITKTLEESSFILGNEVYTLEAQLAKKINANYCITCGNGTDALQIALMALDLRKGDEVIIPAFTYISPLEAAAILKIKPVFVDVDISTFNMDLEKCAEQINPSTKVVLPVHLFGNPVNIHSLKHLIPSKNIYIIEDNAQSLGSYYYHNSVKYMTGALADIGTTSFFPTKILGCYGDGGAIFCNDRELSQKLKMIARHGQKDKYIHEMIGVNSRLDTIQATILISKLNHIEQYIDKRIQVAQFYNNQLNNIEFITTPQKSIEANHCYHQYTLRIKENRRDKLKNYLLKHGIETMVYYPLPLHLQPGYKFLGYKKGDFPISEQLCNELLSLPIYPEIPMADLEYICEKIQRFASEKS
ncbi:MAG: DegT/DnrJ/EryC1/StrS family aminotransferase [Cytophagaceae bacterium]